MLEYKQMMLPMSKRFLLKLGNKYYGADGWWGYKTDTCRPFLTLEEAEYERSVQAFKRVRLLKNNCSVVEI